MPGPVIADPTPDWLKPENASVTDTALTKAMRMIGHLIGADNPTAQVLGLMMTDVPGGSATGGLAKAVEGLKARVIKAYHGSPHDFERFSLEKIGTGEGAQAYGHGLYFAENPAVAEEYKQQLSYPQRYIGEQPIDTSDPLQLAASLMKTYEKLQNPREVVLSELKADIANPALTDVARAKYQKVVQLLESGKSLPEVTVKPTGKTYEVAIHADPEDFLDWDKPLSQQSEKVRKTAERFGPAAERWTQTPVERLNLGEYAESTWGPQYRSQIMKGKKSIASFQGSSPEDVATKIQQWKDTNHESFLSQTGAEFYNNNLAAVGRPGSPYVTTGANQIKATQDLKTKGIPGIKYLDQGSRAAGEGSRNYVVFDDKLIDILKKYGLLLPAAGAATEGQSLISPRGEP